MSLDLTHYEEMYACDKEFAISFATSLVKIMEDKTCCDECETNIQKEFEIPKERLDILCHMTGSMLYSSGYFSFYKIKKNKDDCCIVSFTIWKMTNNDLSKYLARPVTDPVGDMD